VGLVVRDEPCLVVGGGRVAGRKVAALLRCQAAVTMVAPEVHVALGLLASEGVIAAIDRSPLDVQVRPYRAGEAADYRLVVAATGIPAVDRQVHRDARSAGVWVNCADDPDHCTVVLPAVHRDGPVTVAVSTGGTSPALAAWVRRRVAAALGPDLGTLAELLGRARADLHRHGRSTETVDWAGLLDGALPDLVAAGRLDDAEALVRAAVDGPGAADARTVPTTDPGPVPAAAPGTRPHPTHGGPPPAPLLSE
jgi:siroheme synthase-like protein